MKLSVIIPLYNEAWLIAEVIKKVKAVQLPVNIAKEVIIVNDGSTDDSYDQLKKYNSDPEIKIFNLSRRKGKTEAVKLGIKISTGDIILIQDADLEYNPDDYPMLIGPIIANKSRVVYGSRFKGTINGMHLINRIANIVSNATLNLLYSSKITDVNTGYKVFKRDVLDDIKITSKDFTFETEITAKLLNKGYKIYEVPIRYTARSKTEGKKITWPKALQMFWGIIRYRFKTDNQAKNNKEVDPFLYSKEFFFTCNDGFEDFQKGYGLSYIKKKALSFLEIQPDSKFLDVGHGRGEMLYHCEKLGAFVYGIDYSDTANSIAKGVLEHSLNAQIIKADCEHLPFKDGFFDRIFVGDLIEHLSFEKGVQLMKETNRVLAPGGIFLLHTSPNLLFMQIIYPILIAIVGKKKRKEIKQHVSMQQKVHICEYQYFSLKRLIRESNIKARIWIDNDFTRGGSFRHLRNLTPSQAMFIKLVKFLEKHYIFSIKLLFGNDFWIKYAKE